MLAFPDAFAFAIDGHHRIDPASVPDQAYDALAHLNPSAQLLDADSGRLPHLTRTQGRIAELVDQGFHSRSRTRTHPQRGANDRGHRQPTNSLRRPVRADLLTRQSPDLLGVGLEEHLEESTPKCGNHPILEVLRWTPRL